MAGDLHIHVLTPEFDEEHGGRIFEEEKGYKKFSLYDMAEATPNVWVGEVSWLKAALFDASNEFKPGPIEEIQTIIGEEFPVIDEEFIGKITEAMKIPNKMQYVLNSLDTVISFLRNHMGQRVFTISW